MPTSSLERSLVDEALRTLGALPDAQIEAPEWNIAGSGNTDRGFDAQVRLTIAGKSVTILIEAKRALYPRDVSQVLWKLDASDEPTAPNSERPVRMLVSEIISPGAKEMLKRERVGYFDGGGSLFLPAPGAYLYIDKPPAKALQKAIRSLFSGRRAQVSHALLLHPKKWFSGQELAQLAQVSPATASQVLMELERLDWVVSEGEGPKKKRRAQEPGTLLDNWIKQLSSTRPPAFQRYFVPALKTEQLQDSIGRIFDAHAVSYAISFEAAAQRYAPFISSISQVRCRLRPGPLARAALTELDARPVSEGANFAVIDAALPGDLLFREQLDGLWWASPIQVYIDLLRSDGRAKEMAEHLRHERIGF